MPRVFLSYSSGDRPLARQLASDLAGPGVDVWIDEWEIRVGDSITQKVDQGLDEADFVVLLLTRNSMASGWVEKEWRSRIGKEAEAKDVIVLPVRADDCAVPPLLSDRKWADIREDYALGVSQLRAAIDSHFTDRLRRHLPSDLDEIPFMRSLLTEFGVERPALVRVLRAMLPPDKFLGALRDYLPRPEDGDTVEILFYNNYDGEHDLWIAEQAVLKGIVR